MIPAVRSTAKVKRGRRDSHGIVHRPRPRYASSGARCIHALQLRPKRDFARLGLPAAAPPLHPRPSTAPFGYARSGRPSRLGLGRRAPLRASFRARCPSGKGKAGSAQGFVQGAMSLWEGEGGLRSGLRSGRGIVGMAPPRIHALQLRPSASPAAAVHCGWGWEGGLRSGLRSGRDVPLGIGRRAPSRARFTGGDAPFPSGVPLHPSRQKRNSPRKPGAVGRSLGCPVAR